MALKKKKDLAPEAEAEAQIEDERGQFDFDTSELTAEIVAKKMGDGDIFIPAYQRPHVWKERDQCNFIESLILQLPIPYVFCSETSDGTLEVIDGSQRLRTIQRFFSDDLRLNGLEKLQLLNGYRYSDLPLSQRRKLNNRPIRMVTVFEKSSNISRFDIFHRLNTGGTNLTDAQIRRGAFTGPFYLFVRECAARDLFKEMCPFVSNKDADGEREELALRFFAYSDRINDFSHDVAAFLNKYVVETERAIPDNLEDYGIRFNEMLDFVNQHFPYGFFRTPQTKQVPRVRFEAISVGTSFALQTGRDLNTEDFSWLDSEEFSQHTRSDASNSGPKLQGRVYYVRDCLLSD